MHAIVSSLDPGTLLCSVLVTVTSIDRFTFLFTLSTQIKDSCLHMETQTDIKVARPDIDWVLLMENRISFEDDSVR